MKDTQYGKILQQILLQDENDRLLPFSNTAAKNYKISIESYKNTKRNLPNIPEKVLDAPNYLDDFYLNLLDWSACNLIGVALSNAVYLWNPVTQSTSCLVELQNDIYVSGLQFMDNLLAFGDSSGKLHIWDANEARKIRQYEIEESTRLPVISWNPARSLSLSIGSRTGKIFSVDLRTKKSSFVQSHVQEVCGLDWAPDGGCLASGGNDNLVKIWDSRMAVVKDTLTAHTAAVKAIGWCPWKPSCLATGGGTSDRKICLWNSHDGSLTRSVDSGSQVCSLVWSEEYQELATSHGFSENQIMLWKMPLLRPVGALAAHKKRVLQIALSSDKTTVVSAAGDENLKFWKLFEHKKSTRLLEKQMKKWDIQNIR